MTGSRTALVKALDEIYPDGWPRNVVNIVQEAARFRGLPKDFIDKGIFSTVQDAGQYLARAWEKLESRYGRRGALAMAVAMIGTLPIPGNIAAVIAVAEGIRGLHGYLQREYDGDVEKLKGDTVMDVAPEYQLRFPVNRLKAFCPTGAGGGTDNSCSPSGGTRSASSKPSPDKPTHDVKLPKNPKRVNIDTMAQALDQMGYKLSMGESVPHEGTWVTTYRITDRNGNTTTATARALTDMVYAAAKPAKKHFAQKSSFEDAVLQAIDAVGQGSNKFTSIARLGQRLGIMPQTLHSVLTNLLHAGKIGVAPPEGRFGSTDEERRWWLQAQGETFGYVMLRKALLTNRLKQFIRKDKGSYFATCDRDDEGHCKPEGGGGEAATEEKPKKKPDAEKKPKRAAPGSQLHPDTLAKLKELGADKLPPADVPVADIKVNLDAGDSGALMTWKQRSRSGRVSQQSAYTAAFHAKNAEQKWDRVQRVEPHLEAITQGLAQRMQDATLPPRQREAAAITSCIRETGLRPTDSAESVKHGHFGISSLQGRHVKIKGNEVHLDFIGKEGVRNQTVIRDPANVAFIKEAMKTTGPQDFLFKEANSGDAIKTLKEISTSVGGPEDILVKDLRTVNATRWGEEAAANYKGPPPPLTGNAKKDAKQIAKAILTMSGEVSKRLNNNPGMARDNYIHPRVFQKWLSTLNSPN